MAENINLKDLYDEEQSYTDIGTIAVPKTDGSGNTYYVQRPLINYTLQDPPTHELTDADAGMFTWNAGDGTLIAPSGVADDGNVIGMVYAAKEGKTTKPIVRLDVLKNLTGIETGGNSVTLIYCWEEVTSANLKEIIFGANGSDLPEFTTQIGWGYLTQDTEGTVTGYAKIADTSAVTIGIQQPNTIKEGPFYALLAEASLEEKAVTITEKGAQTVVPTIGKSGMSKVNLQVDVAGGNLQEKAVTVTADGIANDGTLYFPGTGMIDVRPDAGYDGVSYAQVVVKANMLGRDDISVTGVDNHSVVYEGKPKGGYIGYAPDIYLDVNVGFARLQDRKTGDEVPNAEITENGEYDIITQMVATNVDGIPTGRLASFIVNVETPPAPSVAVAYEYWESDGYQYSRPNTTYGGLPGNPADTAYVGNAPEGTLAEFFEKYKPNVLHLVGEVQEDGKHVLVNLETAIQNHQWWFESPYGVLEGIVNEDGKSVTFDFSSFKPAPSEDFLLNFSKAIVEESGRYCLFPEIHFYYYDAVLTKSTT